MIAITEHDVSVAHGNWVQYQSVFEHQGPVADNPLLANADLFAAFLNDYSVGRTVRRGTRSSFREALRSSDLALGNRLMNDGGAAIDALDDLLRPDFGTHRGTRRLRSVLSKVAAFVRPDAFVAWDRFARMGLNRANGRPMSFVPTTYQEYLHAVQALRARAEAELTRGVGSSAPSSFAATGNRFQLRVLDVALMRLGGRRFG